MTLLLRLVEMFVWCRRFMHCISIWMDLDLNYWQSLEWEYVCPTEARGNGKARWYAAVRIEAGEYRSKHPGASRLF